MLVRGLKHFVIYRELKLALAKAVLEVKNGHINPRQGELVPNILFLFHLTKRDLSNQWLTNECTLRGLAQTPCKAMHRRALRGMSLYAISNSRIWPQTGFSLGGMYRVFSTLQTHTSPK